MSISPWDREMIDIRARVRILHTLRECGPLPHRALIRRLSAKQQEGIDALLWRMVEAGEITWVDGTLAAVTG